MNTKYYIDSVANGNLDSRFAELYGSGAIPAQRDRYIKALESFETYFGTEHEINIYSVSGRSELAGNHTDHNNGKVIAGAIDLDIIAIASKSGTDTVSIKSDGYNMFSVDLAKYCKPDEKLFGTSASLVAGVADGFKNRGEGNIHIGLCL